LFVPVRGGDPAPPRGDLPVVADDFKWEGG
jgi:hypothetical protein